jgi:hypothetical protein
MRELDVSVDSISITHTDIPSHTRARKHACTHAHTHTRGRAHAQTYVHQNNSHMDWEHKWRLCVPGARQRVECEVVVRRLLLRSVCSASEVLR